MSYTSRLGLQVIYDPDPNPKNEEQAIARSHRIGQTREVRHQPCKQQLSYTRWHMLHSAC